MKKTVATALLAFAAIAFIFTACKKYEEGPTISLSSKKARLANTWKIDKYLVDGVDQTSTYLALVGTSASITYDKSGSYTSTYSSGTETGTWEFIEKKEAVKTLSNLPGSMPKTLFILKLKSKELWYYESGTPKKEYHLAPK